MSQTGENKRVFQENKIYFLKSIYFYFKKQTKQILEFFEDGWGKI